MKSLLKKNLSLFSEFIMSEIPAFIILVTIAFFIEVAPLASGEVKDNSNLRANCPVVDFGDDYCWHVGTQGLPTYRSGNVTKLFKGSQQGTNIVDVDGDGKTDDDATCYYEFSLSEPLNQQTSEYNIKGNNAIFYGGLVSYFANKRPQWSEGGINANHELRDDFNFHSYALEGGDKGVKVAGVWLWKKEDFLNGGDKFPVSFNQSSKLAVYISRYWKDYDEARFVVCDGNQFYISETTFGGNTHTLYQINPTETKWAEYNPEAPYSIFFKRDDAVYNNYEFKDIQSVGWYITKNKVGKAALWLKWYGFTMDAVVNAPENEINIVPMRESSDGLLISKQAVTYREWRKIYKWAYRNQWALHENYVFNRDGDMGTMDFDNNAHDWTEPVTDITWLDALVWCNALSEYEGKIPCYYTDSDFTKVLRKSKERFHPDNYGKVSDVYVDWKANGYRLPTFKECTVNVKNLKNLRQLCWDVSSENYNPVEDTTHTAVGGKSSVVGFSLVRTPEGIEKPDTSIDAIKNDVPQWTFQANTNFAAADIEPDVSILKMLNIPGGKYTRAADDAEINISDFSMSSTEIPFDLWKKVYNWASANGYEFDYDGDMGSMDWSDKGAEHTPSEPVTDISAYDAMLWCNALSELQGKTPFYYSDEAKTKVYRKAEPFRMLAVEGREAHYKLPGQGKVKLYQKWDADGYRLPTEYEWEYAYRDGSSTFYEMPWGGNKIDDRYLWYAENSSDKTHPVGIKQPNNYGLYDMAGNVFEWTMGDHKNDYYDRDNPRGQYPIFKSSSFRTGKTNQEIMGIIATGKDARLPLLADLTIAKPEIGFRIVSCKKGLHPSEKPKYVPKKVIDLDANQYDLN